MTYLSTKNEVETLSLAARLLDEEVRVAVPRLFDEHPNRMEWSEIHSMDALVEGPFGILQPLEDASVPVSEEAENSPVLVPVVAVNLASGHRIGHGGGYFDRYLANHSGVKIALAFEHQLCEAFEASSYDVRMDYIVTERDVYEVSDSRKH